MTRGIKPLKTDIIEGIKSAWSCGDDLRVIAVQKGSNRWMYRSCSHYFKSWKDALKASGISYKDTKERSEEIKRLELLSEIEKAHENGVEISSSSLQKDLDNRHLYERAKRFYSGRYLWEKVIEDCGLDVESIVRQRAWDKDKVVKEFKARDEAGLKLFSNCVKNDNSALYKAAINHFDSYDDALRKSGFDPAKIKKANPRLTSELKEKILEYYVKGTDLRPPSIKSGKDNELKCVFYAAYKRFNGWWNALKVCGIKPDLYRQTKSWNKEKVAVEIRRLDNEGISLNTTSIIDEDNKLYKAALRYYGSWKKALTELDYDYDEINTRSSLSKDEIICRIKDAKSKGVLLNCDAVLRSEDKDLIKLLHQSYRRFDGGWDEALDCAGLDSNEIRKRRKTYTLEELTDIVEDLENRGVSLDAISIQSNPETSKIFSAAANRYSSWYEFLDKIGKDVSKYRIRRVNNTKETVISEYQEYYPSGFVNGVSKKYINLTSFSQKFFGSISNAVEAAGMVYSRYGKISVDFLRKNPLTIERLWMHNQEFIQNICRTVYFGAKARGLYSHSQDDLMQEAFIMFSGILTQKPKEMEFREFIRNPLFRGLIDLNWKLNKERKREHLWENADWFDYVDNVCVF
ncbi:hypothetical protein GOV12_01900 [Candidatus Pacearchaeota archaeon]|nr:hypothetical protein [Candidatus Pacearchaeota archaeon]